MTASEADIFHIVPAPVWAAAGAYYHGDTLATEGFIHCSDAQQVLRVANGWFRDAADLVLVAIARSRVEAEIRYEDLYGANERFPHIYGPLNRDAVVCAEPLCRDSGGGFAAPPYLAARLAVEDRTGTDPAPP